MGVEMYVLRYVQAMCASHVKSLDDWSRVAGETLQWYCETTRGQPTDERNRGEALQMLAAWLYRNILEHVSFEDAYDACCRVTDEASDEYPFMWQSAQNAIDVQDACNLTGVLYSFLREIAFLQSEHEAGRIREPVDKHYITRLYADKVCDLAGVNQAAAADKALGH